MNEVSHKYHCTHKFEALNMVRVCYYITGMMVHFHGRWDKAIGNYSPLTLNNTEMQFDCIKETLFC